jgi:hypothetical protein
VWVTTALGHVHGIRIGVHIQFRSPTMLFVDNRPSSPNKGHRPTSSRSKASYASGYLRNELTLAIFISRLP